MQVVPVCAGLVYTGGIERAGRLVHRPTLWEDTVYPEVKQTAITVSYGSESVLN